MQKGLLISFAILLSCCTPPPKGPQGIIGDSGCIYHDPSLAEDKQDYTLTFPECINHIATTADYHRILYRAYADCLKPAPGPMCIVGQAAVICWDTRPMDSSNICFNRQLVEGTCDVPFPEAVNMIVTTPEYARILRDWYRRRCE